MALEILSSHRATISRYFEKGPLPPGSNPGLVFDRYLPMWDKNGERVKELYKPLADFASAFKQRGKDCQTHLDRLHERQERIMHNHASKKGGAGRYPYSVAWRLVCGLGNDHPTDNGFTLDTLLGVPYIRGAALKGLCRRAAELEGWPPDTLRDLFGSQDPHAPESLQANQCGDIVFLDAYPTEWPKIEVDIMNTHHPKYYQNPETNPPLETEDPVPVFFLTVGSETEFIFRLFSRAGKASHVNQMQKALSTGLTVLGVGAKTAVGYGRFKPPVSEGEKWVDRQLEALSAEHNEPNKMNVLRGKPLVNRWQEITDPKLKESAREEIKRRLQQEGQWDASSRSFKRIKSVYEGK